MYLYITLKILTAMHGDVNVHPDDSFLLYTDIVDAD